MLLAVREYLNANSWKSTPQGIVNTVAEVLQSSSGPQKIRLEEALNNPEKSSISERTARKWLAKLGWIYSRDKKGYIDGHEREDVVDYRNNIFIPKMKALAPYLEEYGDDGEIPKEYPDGIRKVLVTHNESTFNTNDDKQYHWKKKGTEPLKPKSKGKGLMVSEFLTAAQGRLHCINEDSAGNRHITSTTEIIQYGSGKNDDGWWTAEKMVEQVRDKAIPIFEKAFLEKTAVFIFDNSSSHTAIAPDALVASRINLKPSGNQPIMHSTVYGPNNMLQSMIFLAHETDNPDLVGKPKGMRRILEERGL